MTTTTENTIHERDLPLTEQPGPAMELRGLEGGRPIRLPLHSVTAPIDSRLTNLETAQGTTTGRIASLEAASAQADDRIGALEYGQSAGQLVLTSWAELSAIPTTAEGHRGAQVIGDTGTHTDPVTGEAVSNSGQYVERADGWEWVRADVLAGKASVADLDALNSTVRDFTSGFGFESLDEAPANLPILDPQDRVVLEIPYSATGVTFFEAVDNSEVPLLLDAEGRVLLTQPQPADAPASPPVTTGIAYRLDRLRKTNMRLFGIESGASGHKLNITCFGDSWIDVSTFWLRSAAEVLRAKYGDAGIGYVDLGSGNVPRSGVSYSASGSWTVHDETGIGPALYIREGSEGATLTISASSWPAGLESATLIFEGVDAGTLTYSWSSGEADEIDMAGDGVFSASLGTTPASTPWSLTLSVQSGMARIAGIYFDHARDGVVVNKCGNSGSTSADWTGVNGAKWSDAVSKIPTDVAVILLGTNDVRDGIPPETYAANIAEMVGRIREAHPAADDLPGPDVMVVIPPEVWRSGAHTPTKPYLAAILEIADSLDIAVLDLTESLGDPYDRRDWFDSVGVHPVTATSGRIIARQFVKSLTAY